MILVSVMACTVCSVFKTPASVCLAAVAAVIILAAAGGVFAKRRCVPSPESEAAGPDKVDIALALTAAGIVLLQILAAVYYRYGGTGPIRCIAVATRMYESGYLFPSDPMMLLIGCVSNVSGIHPLVIVYTVMPLTFITLYYLCYCCLIDTVCLQRRQKIIAFMAVCLLNVWGYQSDKLSGAVLLLSWFGIWAFVVHGFLNTAAVILIRYAESRPGGARAAHDETDHEISEEWDMNRHKIINARNLAIALGVLTVALIGTVLFLNHKINRLYDATVNLQTDMNNRCSVYEFIPDGGEIQGYLLMGSDGSLSFIGGGGEENADELELFMSRYGNEVANWYIYGEDDENAGAMRKLTGLGTVRADRVFVIDRKEITQIR